MGESARYTYRLRMSAAAQQALLAEWDRCRWIWNECVAQSRIAHRAQRDCGPAMLDLMLTGWRAEHEWLRAGASVSQQQTIRDFGLSRAKALKDMRARLPISKRAGMPRFKLKHQALPTLNYCSHPAWARQPGRSRTMARKAADAAIGITKAALIEAGRKHDRRVVLVDPRYTTMDCGHCGARTKHRLPLSERIYTCSACGTVSSRDKNSAHVMLVRAGFVPCGADRTSPCHSLRDTGGVSH